MNPRTLGAKYDTIARWWHDRHHASGYGMAQLERALSFCPSAGEALDVGCGAGGRFVRRLRERGFGVTGIDVSAEMIRLARQNHPEASFAIADICTWETTRAFDLIVAWDSIFHLPLAMHEPVLSKLCNLLAPAGVVFYSFGDAQGAHDDEWRGEAFHYSSIGIDGNLRVLMDCGVGCKHLELDQWPQNHVYLIGQKPRGAADAAE